MPTAKFKGAIIGFTERKKWESNGKSGENCNVIIDTETQYDNLVCVQFYDKQFEEMFKYKIGDEVEIHININSSPYTDRQSGKTAYFPNLKLWKIEKLAAVNTQPTQQAAPPTPAPAASYSPQPDDLPF